MKKSIFRYGWEYTIDDQQNLKILPKPSDRKPLPKSLFKYYRLDSLSIDALSKSYIYAPHPGQFNDPIDCSHLMITFNDPKFIYDFLKPILPNSMSYEEIKQKVELKDSDLLRLVQNGVKQISYARMGIISLCNNPESMLMWTYYTDHRGYCIEYDYPKFPFKILAGPLQVNYQKIIKPISATNEALALNKSLALALVFLYQTNVKAKCWQHESEWRLLVEKEGPNKRMIMPGIKGIEEFQGVDRKFEYFSNNILSITLGHRFFEQEEFLIDSGKVYITLKKERALKEKFLAICETEKFLLYQMFIDPKTLSFNRTRIIVEKVKDNKYEITS